MDLKNESPERYRYGQFDGYEARCKARLLKDLGVEKAAAETILHLRSQVIELQDQIRRLKAELSAQDASQHLRLARYREVYYETTWIEVKIQE